MPELNFVVDMKVLREHVNFVRNGLGNSRTDLPVMMMRFEVKGERATIFTENKEIFCRTEMKVSREDPEEVDGYFGVLGSKIEQLISRVDSDQVRFKSDGSENLEVKAGFLLVNFELYDSSSLKTIETGVNGHLEGEGYGLDRTSFEEALSCGKTCTSNNSTKPDLNHVEMRGGRVLSSDGRKIMIYSHQDFPEKVNFKVPSSCINDVINAVRNMANTETIQVLEGKSYYFLKGQGNKFSMGVRKVERKFPAIEKQIVEGDTAEEEISIDKGVLEGMLKGVALGLPYEEVRVEISLRGEGNQAVMEISSLNSIGRKSYESASCGRKAGIPMNFPLSFRHLLDTLSVFKGDSVVDMMIQPKKNLLMVRDTNEARQVLTVIPFRTEKAIQEEKKEKDAVVTTKPIPVVNTNEELPLEDAAVLE